MDFELRVAVNVNVCVTPTTYNSKFIIQNSSLITDNSKFIIHNSKHD